MKRGFTKEDFLKVSLYVCATSLQSGPTFCSPMDCSPPGSSGNGILRQEYWSGLLCLSPGDLPDLGIEPAPLMSPAVAGRFFSITAT